MSTHTPHYIQVMPLKELKSAGHKTAHVAGHTIAFFDHNDRVYAVDNRCPHMGFPLDRGTVHDCILTCHWHHARFDLETGGTFDQFADDVRVFPVDIRDGMIWVDVTAYHDPHEHQHDRLHVGLERDIPLVLGKAVLTLVEEDGDPVVPFQAGLDFGTQYRRNGWGQGLTMHTCLLNMLPHLDAAERPRALYHGLSAVARESFGAPPRFRVRPLPDVGTTGIETFKRWFRQFIEVRDAEGAERCVVSAIRAGADDRQMAGMLFAAITDHRYIDIGHPADFANKAFEALDVVGWDYAEQVLTSLVRAVAFAARMEESNAWRHPVDLVAHLDTVFEQLPGVIAQGQDAASPAWDGRDALIPVLHSDDPHAITAALLDALSEGCSMVELAATVSYAAALRIAHFHTSNEFSDWDTALHTFTFANAIEAGLRRAPSADLLRGVFDAAMSVYLDRFLNIPSAPIPKLAHTSGDPEALLNELASALDKQQQVNQAASLIARYLGSGGDPDRLLAMLGTLLLREDRDFHTIQTVEAAFSQYKRLRGTDAGAHVLIAAGRYLAAHAPTVRAQGQTYEIASRLHRGEILFEDA